MLEKVVTFVLNHVLGKYIDGITADQLNFSLWGGCIVLKDLKFKPSAIEELLQDARFKSGNIGKIEIFVPWTNLRNEPITITIEDVVVEVMPKEKLEWSRAKELEAKRAIVKQLENMKNNSTSSYTAGYFDYLVTPMVDNIQFIVKRVSLNYSNKNKELEEHPVMSATVTIAEVTVFSANEDFTAMSMNRSHRCIHKAVRIENMLIDWPNDIYNPKQTDSRLLSVKSIQINATIENDSDSILYTPTVPRVKAAIEFGTTKVSLSQQQYQDVLSVVDYTLKMKIRKKYYAYRPEVSPKEHPKAWWFFALQCFRVAKEGFVRPTPLWVLQRNKDKVQYKSIYKKMKYSKLEDTLTETQSSENASNELTAAEFDEMELRLPVSDIVKFRTEAKKELISEGYYQKKYTEEEKHSWLSSWLPAELQYDEEHEDQELAVIEDHVDEAEKKELPLDVLKFEFKVLLKAGKFKLSDLSLTDRDSYSIAEYDFKDLFIESAIYEETVKVIFSLHHFRLYDKYTLHSQFPVIMEPLRIQDAAVIETESDEDVHSLSLMCEYRPFSKPGVDYYLSCKTKPFQLVYNKYWVEKLSSFFAKIIVPDLIVAELKQIEEFSLDILAEILRSNQIIKIEADVQAPKILLPADTRDPYTVSVFADLGRLTIDSPIIEQKIKLKDGDVNELQNAAEREIFNFNTFNLYLKQLFFGTTTAHSFVTDQSEEMAQMRKGQLIFSDGVPSLKRQISSSRIREQHVVIQDFDINMQFDLCSVMDETLPEARLMGNLPSLQLTLSAKVIQQLFTILTTAILPDAKPGEVQQPRPKRSEKKKDKKNEKTLAIHQRELNSGFIFFGSFTVDKLALTINRDLDASIHGSCVGDLVVAYLNEFNLQISLRENDTSVVATVCSFNIDDQMQTDGPDFKRIISSQDTNSQGQLLKESEPLLKFSLLLIEKTSPEYKGVDTVIFLDLHHLNVIFNRETVLELVRFFNEALLNMNNKQAVTTKAKPLAKQAAEATVSKTSVKIESVACIFNRAGKKFASCSLGTTSLLIDSQPSVTVISGSLGKVSLQDTSAPATEREIVSILGDDTVEFTYHSYNQEVKRNPYDGELILQVNTILVYYAQAFFNSLTRYFSRMIEKQQVMESTAKYAQNAQLSSMKVLFQACIKSPKVLIPCKIHKDQHLTADFGDISATNKYIHEGEPDYSQQITIFITAMNLEVFNSKLMPQSQRLIENIDFKATVDVLQSESSKKPGVAVQADIHDIALSLNESHYLLLVDLYKQYFPATETTAQAMKAKEKVADVMETSVNVHLSAVSLKLAGLTQASTESEQTAEAPKKKQIKLNESSEILLSLSVKDIDKKDTFGLSDPYLVIYRLSGNTRIEMHQTEIIEKTLTASFKEFSLPVNNLLNDEGILIECYDWNRVQAREFIGSAQMIMSDLFAKNKFELINHEKLRKEPNYAHSGILQIDAITPVNAVLTDELLTEEEDDLSDEEEVKKRNGEQFLSDVAFFKISDINVAVNMFKLGTIKVLSQISELQIHNPRSDGVKEIALGNQVKLDYCSSDLGAQNMDLELSKMSLIVVPDFLLLLNRFIMTGVNRFLEDDTDKSHTKEVTFENMLHFVMSARVASLRVHLLEKPDSLTGNRLTLDTEVNANINMIGLVSEYNVRQTSTKFYKIIDDMQTHLWRPFSAEVHYIDHPDQGTIGLLMDPVTMRIAYEDYLIFYSIANTFMSVFSKMQEQEEKPVQHFTPDKKRAVPVNLEIGIPTLKVILVSPSSELPPLVELAVSAVDVGGNLTENAMAEFQIMGRYYNLRRAFWEPLIESTLIKIKYKYDNQDSKFIIKSSDHIETNLTHGLYFGTQIWTGQIDKPEKSFHPISIRNFTSKEMIWQLSINEKKNILAAGKEAPLFFPFTELADLNEFKKCTLSISTDTFSVKELSMVEEGIALFTVVKDSKEPEDKLIYEVNFIEGRRILTFRSLIQIRNSSSLPVAVKAEIKGEGINPITYELRPVQPGDDASIPLEFVKNGLLYFRPHDEGANFSWSNELECLHLASSGIDQCVIKRTENQDINHFYHLDINQIDCNFATNMFAITVVDPIVIENLLPCQLSYRFSNGPEGNVESQLKCPVNSIPLKLLGDVYVKVPGFEWSDRVEMDKSEGKIILSTTKHQGITLHFQRSYCNNNLHLTIYCEFWVINRTEFNLTLSTRRERNHFSSTLNEDEPIIKDLSEYSPTWYSVEKAKNNRPFLFSCRRRVEKIKKPKKVYVSIENSTKSKGIRFGAIETGEVAIADNKDHMSFRLGVSVQLGVGKMRLTKMVTFAPRILLLNNMGRKLYYQQVGTEKRFCLLPDEALPVHFDTRGKELLSFSLDQGNTWTWSGGLALNEVGEFYLKLFSNIKKKEYFVRVDVEFQNNTTFVVQFNPKRTGVFPYKIENQTNQAVTIWQQKQEQVVRTIPPGESLSYAWDEPTFPHILELRFEDSKKIYEVNPDVVESSQFRGSMYASDVTIEARTRILWLKDYRSHMGEIDKQARIRLEDSEPKSIFAISIPSISFSIVDKFPKEILYCTLEGISLAYAQSLSKTTMQMAIDYFQVDNQLYLTPYPVMIHPVLPEKPEDRRQFISVGFQRSNKYMTIDYIDYFSFLMQEVNVFVDSSLVNSLLALQKALTKGDELSLHEEEPVKKNDIMMKPTYFRLLCINPLRINVSFINPTYTTEETDYLRQLAGPIVGTIPTIDRAPLTLDALVLEHPITERQKIIQIIQKHYQTEIIRDSLKLIGSFEFIGNPVNLFGHLARKSKTVVYDPLKIQPIIKDPEDLKIEVKTDNQHQASEDDEVNVVNSAASAVSKVTKAATRATATLSGDKKFKADQEIKVLEPVDGLKDGLSKGYQELGHGIISGLTGIVKQPIKGAKSEGAKGAIKGIGLGLVGVFAKPTAGFMDFTTKSLQGLSGGTEKANIVHRKRLPRNFGKSKILEPYSLEMAYGKFALVTISDGKYEDEECAYNVIIGPKLYLVSDQRLMCVNVSNFSLRWQVGYKDVLLIHRNEEGDIILEEAKPDSGHEDAHSCQYLQPECDCHIPPELLSGRRFIVECHGEESDLLYATIFKEWALWHRVVTEQASKKTLKPNVAPMAPLKRELTFFGQKEIESRQSTDIVEREKLAASTLTDNLTEVKTK